MTKRVPSPSKRPSGQTPSTRTLNDEMPDPDNLRIDRTALVILPNRVFPAPTIGERLAPARHRADFSRSA